MSAAQYQILFGDICRETSQEEPEEMHISLRHLLVHDHVASGSQSKNQYLAEME